MCIISIIAIRIAYHVPEQILLFSATCKGRWHLNHKIRICSHPDFKTPCKFTSCMSSNRRLQLHYVQIPWWDQTQLKSSGFEAARRLNVKKKKSFIYLNITFFYSSFYCFYSYATKKNMFLYLSNRISLPESPFLNSLPKGPLLISFTVHFKARIQI